MKYILLSALLSLGLMGKADANFPDGTTIAPWFSDYKHIDIDKLGKHYVITDHGVLEDSTLIQTQAIQNTIDLAAKDGGVVIIPRGVYLSGSLFFRQGTHLHIMDGGVLKGSDDISNFPVVDTRIEGQSLKYFAALINADGVDGFTISGRGTIDGNGERYWRSFWLRRKVNPKCTNMDELRPRLIYISNSKNIQLEGVTLRNSPFWTTHIYRVERVRFWGLKILAPHEPIKAPSSDAIDIDVCMDVHIKDCYISVNDDGIALKGGKGPWAQSDSTNGGNYNILIEDCQFGYCHSALTCGSESIHNRNVIMRRCQVDKADRLLWLKMRPDTPQNYEYILIEDIRGSAGSLLFIRPWSQFFDMKDRKDVPISFSSNVTLRNIELECDVFFNVKQANDQYRLSDFTFENLKIEAKDSTYSMDYIDGLKLIDVNFLKK